MGNEVLQTVTRALKLLDSFLIKSEWTLTELAKHLNLNKTVVYRLLETLTREHYLEYNNDIKRYRLGYKIISLGFTESSRLDIRNISKEIMERIARKGNISVYLTVASGDFSLCISKIDSNQELRYAMEVGETYPLHLGASNKTLLAYKSEKEICIYLERLQFSKDKTDKLKEELKQIRDKGYCYSSGELTNHVYAIGIPIFNYENKVVAVLSAAGPMVIYNNEDNKNIRKNLYNGAKSISNKLGCKAYPTILI